MKLCQIWHSCLWFFLKGNFHQNFELMSTFGDILWKKKVWIRKCLVNVVISKIWRKFPTISKFNQIYTRKKINLNFLVQKEPKNSGKNKTDIRQALSYLDQNKLIVSWRNPLPSPPPMTIDISITIIVFQVGISVPNNYFILKF